MQKNELAPCHYEKQSKLLLDTHVMIPRRIICKSAHDIALFCQKLHHPNVLLKNQYGHVLCTNIEKMKQIISSKYTQPNFNTLFLEESIIHTHHTHHVIRSFSGYRIVWENKAYCLHLRKLSVTVPSCQTSPVLHMHSIENNDHHLNSRHNSIYHKMVSFIEKNSKLLGEKGCMDICYLHDERQIYVTDIYTV